MPEDNIQPISQKIFSSLIEKKASQPNISTVTSKLTPVNYLSELDRLTTQLIQEILAYQTEFPNQIIRIQGVNEVLDTEGKFLNGIILKRLKRQFIEVNKKGVEKIGLDRVKEAFLRYLKDGIKQ